MELTQDKDGSASGSLPTSGSDALLLNCKEKLDALGTDLALVSGNVEAASPEFLRAQAQRLQSVQEIANSLGLYSLKHLSQMLESVLADVQEGQLTPSAANMKVFLPALDRMKQLAGNSEPLADVRYGEELKGLISALSARRKTQLFSLPHSRRLRVLLGEDDPVSIGVLQGMLSKYGDCDTVGDGRRAVATFGAARSAGLAYDLVCLDVNMPEMKGPQALKQIRKIEIDDPVPTARTRIFMTTSVNDFDTVAGSIRLKCDAYLLKPIDFEKLEERLRFFGLIRRERWLVPP